MILVSALALLAPQAASGEELVIAGRPQPLRISVKRDPQQRINACEVVQSSSDEAFDRLTCETAAACSREEDRSLQAVKTCTQAAMAAVDRDQSGANSE
ncbi:hypothetical protein ACMGDH_06835 [Sphingomonas sp. DT-207]|uniref:hypothetical protein n=1 Tax=Sphingomonas sp. DT-207 TaxID=3396167 RepID=UPI003F1BCC17